MAEALAKSDAERRLDYLLDPDTGEYDRCAVREITKQWRRAYGTKFIRDRSLELTLSKAGARLAREAYRAEFDECK
jgi:hypothetical protein